jgi:hypothetical protein
MVNTASYRDARLRQHEIDYDEHIWLEWYRYNEFNRDIEAFITRGTDVKFAR